MIRTIGPVRAGVALAVALGAFHAGWACLVAIGVAQPFIDFILRLHFIQPFYVIQPFNIVTAIGLVAFSSLSGFCLGCAFAAAWNYFHR